MRISIFDTPEQRQFKEAMLAALSEASKLFPSNDLTICQRGNHWCEMALWLDRYNCLIADVYSPEDITKQALVWAWECFVDADQERENFAGFGSAYHQAFHKTNAMIINGSIIRARYYAPEKVADLEWMLFQECN